MKIFAFHLLNDYSGSPKVLKQLVKGWIENKINVTIVINSGSHGFLSTIPGANYRYHSYQWHTNRFLRLIILLMSQVFLIVKYWNIIEKEDVIYVNTVLPFGAGILGKLKGCRVIYHIHETSIKPLFLKKFLFYIVNFTAHDVIYVSRYLSQTEVIQKPTKHVHYNAIENEFLNTIHHSSHRRAKRENVLMIASLKSYKGIYEFLELAASCPSYKFRLVVNANDNTITHFFKSTVIPFNITMYSTQSNVHPFYEWADVVLNLSRPDGWVETFGLTILEAMSYHLPAIIPTVGGITELVEEGINGFHVDCRDNALLKIRLKTILESDNLYRQMSEQASIKIKSFTEKEFITQSLSLLYTNHCSKIDGPEF